MNCRLQAWICALGIVAAGLWLPVTHGQEAAKDQPKAAVSDNPAEAKPEASSEAAAPTSGARAAFDKKIEEWRDLLKEMRKLKLEFQLVAEGDIPKYQEQWSALILKGQEMLPELRDLSLAAYEEAGGADPQLERFLVKFVLDAVELDDFETGYDLAMKLIEKGASDRKLYDAVGVSAFCTNRYDDAEKYLKLAKDGGVLSQFGGEILPLIAVEKDLWLQEVEIRKKEEETNDLPQVKLTTSKGEILVELYENQAPDTVGNFVHLVEKGFYDGLTFHRVLQHFVAQGGDPKGDGTGGPGWQIYDEVNREDYRRHFRGCLSMAKTAEANTGGSQFFLTFRPTPNLDGRHTCFGRILSGMEVLSRLTRINPDMPTPGAVPDKILKAEVIRKREHAYEPKKVEQ